MKLYDLKEAFYNVEMLINNAETDDELLWFKEAMLEVEASIEEKVESYVFVIKNMEADEQALKQEEARLKAKRQTMARRKDNLKGMLKQFMEETGNKSYKFPHSTVSIRNNPPSLYVVDEAKIPADYFIQPAPLLDKVALKNAIKDGEMVEGAKLVQNQSLQIR